MFRLQSRLCQLFVLNRMKKVRFSTKKLAYVEKKQRMFVEKSVDFA